MTAEARLRLLAARIGAQIKAMTPRLMPSGGKAGQILAKTSASDYAAAWTDNNPKLMGTVMIGQSALITTAIPYMLSATLPGVKAGDVLMFVPTSSPDNRQTGQCRCDADGVVKVSVQGPALGLLDSYTITGIVLKLR